MSDPNQPSEDAEFEAFAEEYEEHRSALFEIVSDYADEQELDDGLLVALLLDLAVTARMISYADGTEKPSATGLKLELDRFLKDAGDHVREVKQGAEEFIADIKQAREEEN
ncbi:hypothetical protein OSH08_21360 [Kaistia geumhonensis]|jgi:hypothetical protein|uniref:Uncharacterized protein n=1 Tax=Kaistia geumhonensis TaxID=410839 RepID=A0ABU0MCI5_9HYPH|nr:hypothetical protein [Kaistia geumhonensis]MCX5481561.1 hypothetical protein [Kaistia geumhonensis]MDQ0518627.1 hypothetical protein [Kaistia geumhonensis]